MSGARCTWPLWAHSAIRAPGPDWILGAHSHRNIGAVYDASHASQYFQAARLARLYEVVVYFEDTSASRVYPVPAAASAEASAMR